MYNKLVKLPDGTESYLTIDEIVNVLNHAKKEFYIYSYRYPYMCVHIANAIKDIFNAVIFPSEIIKYIPKFNPIYLDAKRIHRDFNPYSSRWWDTMDIKSRNIAFNKLIKYYTNLSKTQIKEENNNNI